MAKAKTPAKEAPKARSSKASARAAEKALLEGAMTEAPAPLDAEARKTRLKNLIKLGKERGYLTYAEINDHLPDDVVDAEQIESIISTFNDMGIQVFDEAPAAEELLMSETAPTVADDEEVEEEAEQALSTVDSEFGRTTDPVRMYMREMGSVELLTREGEIEIAKRIEDGLKHMIQAISACPTTIAEILDMAVKVESEEMRIDELVDGLIDPNAVEKIVHECMDAGLGDDEIDRRLLALFPKDLRVAKWNREYVQKGMTPSGRDFLKEALTVMGCPDRTADIISVTDLMEFDEGRIE